MLSISLRIRAEMACKFPHHLQLSIPFPTSLSSSPTFLPLDPSRDPHWPPWCFLNPHPHPHMVLPQGLCTCHLLCFKLPLLYQWSQWLFFSLLFKFWLKHQPLREVFLDHSPPKKISKSTTYRYSSCPHLLALFIAVALVIHYTFPVWFIDCLLSPTGCTSQRART